jgi:hypothetical protein
VREGSRTLTKAQLTLQQEFIDAYGFKPEQIGFDGDSPEPIFDFDALSLLSMKLCDLPHVETDFGTVERLHGLATARGIVTLPNGNVRKIFASASVGELMPDGEPIRDVNQAIQVARARAFRTILRAVGFDPVAAHRVFEESAGTQMLELAPVDPRLKQLAEIHLHAQAQNLIVVGGDGFVNRKVYEQKLAMICGGKTSCRDLDDRERAIWLQTLRAWSRAKNITRRVAYNRERVAQAV